MIAFQSHGEAHQAVDQKTTWDAAAVEQTTEAQTDATEARTPIGDPIEIAARNMKSTDAEVHRQRVTAETRGPTEVAALHLTGAAEAAP